MKRAARSARAWMAGTLLLLGTGCNHSSEAPHADEPVPEDLAAGETRARQLVADDVNYGSVERRYLLHLPEGMNSVDPRPVVFVFHGTGGDAFSTESASHFSASSDEHGFIVVYPQALGVPRNEDSGLDSTLPGTQSAPAGWNTRPAASNYGAINEIDDAGFVEQLLESLMNEFPVDDHRIYSTGLSNGCGFTTVLMARLNETLAATAQNACGMYPVNVVPQDLRKIPFMVLHGTDDTVVPYDGSAGTAVSGGRTPLPEIMGDWADFYECDGRNTSLDDDIERWDYEGCIEDISFLTIHGGEHRWYPWQAEVIQEFFRDHPLQ